MSTTKTTQSRKVNKVFASIKSLGLNIESRQGDDGWNRLYLNDKEGNRITHAFYYRSNNKGDSEECFKTTYSRTHKDKAMREALEEVFYRVNETLKS